MTPVRKAIWYIEGHFTEPLTLEDVAVHSGVSPYHLARAFAAVTGQPVMRYVRGRRLSEAARKLAGGAPNILSVALDAGYASHEAFTRAFRDQFGLTPDALRSRGVDSGTNLVEPFNMTDAKPPTLDPPRTVTTRQPLLIAGLGQRISEATRATIPAQWQRFAPHIGHVPGQVGPPAYGVICNSDDDGTIDYIAGIEVSDFSRLPGDFARLRIAPARYAVFLHRDHVAGIHASFMAIWETELARAGLHAADAPVFERYDERFDPETGLGGVEIWLPIAPATAV
ncbi:MAG TPA: AraC family transcriptional regulator [Vineibacter sp.]|nr:AraC family transcriptional regulator [Vineibacter sp.]